MEYWDKENARRHELRKVVKMRLRDVARSQRECLYECHPLDEGKQREEVGRCLRAER